MSNEEIQSQVPDPTMEELLKRAQEVDGANGTLYPNNPDVEGLKRLEEAREAAVKAGQNIVESHDDGQNPPH